MIRHEELPDDLRDKYLKSYAEWARMSDNIRKGTVAIHKLGDISRDEEDFFVFHSETETEYIGNWITGFGFIDVRFPKATSREITAEEREWLAENPASLA